MARYRKVDVRIWLDESFCRLTPSPPCGQTLWLYLITNPSTTNVPGLYRAGEGAMTDDLKWSVDAVHAAFDEIAAQGMAEVDWNARVVFIPKAINYDPPESPNVVAGWRSTLDEIPECTLKTKAVASLRQHLEQMGPAWVGAFDLASKLPRDRRRLPDEITRAAVKLRDGDLCRYCGREVKWTDRRGPQGATLDHVDPTGPSSEANLVVACRGCNSFKGFRTPEMAEMRLEVVPKSPPSNDLDPDSNGSRSDSRRRSRSDLDPDLNKPANPEPEQEQDPDPEGSGEASRPSPQPLALRLGERTEKAILVFPTVRGGRNGGSTWSLVASDLQLLRDGFPGVNVLAECKQALVWAVANPTKQKTASGMLSFLNRWMAKVQNQGGPDRKNGTVEHFTRPKWTGQP